MKNYGAKCQKCQLIVVVVDRIEVTAKQSAPWGIFPPPNAYFGESEIRGLMAAQGNRVMAMIAARYP